EDPKKTYDLVKQVIGGITKASMTRLLKEITTIKRSSFTTIGAYTTRMETLRRMLKKTGVDLNDNALMGLTLNGLEDVYPAKYERWVATM
ncbi:hypothetical protein B0H67DRAFT_459033, partial [Lasiosphaeris hirsuta]